jgi:hypothetical protein
VSLFSSAHNSDREPAEVLFLVPDWVEFFREHLRRVES